ncbi:MAG: methyltransferase domain-containing protein [Chloroflexota bacterium]
MTTIFVLTVRGLEAVSAAELSALPGITVGETAYRRVLAECSEALAPLLDLRTVDDTYLDLGTWSGIGHTREMLAAIQWYATQIELETAAQTIKLLRALPEEPQFSVTASFVGRRNFSTDEIKLNVAAGIKERFGLRYTPDDREADLNVRVFIEHEAAFIGLRLGKHPLHERGYKVAERAGSLKPSVAAAMLRLAQVEAGQRLLDPCCGSGTILIEGALRGAIAEGGDIERDAVAAAQANAQAAGLNLAIHEWDARALPLPDGSVERVVTNLPWGKQIAVDDSLARLYGDICGEIERVLLPGGRVALLSSLPELVHFEKLREIEAVEISLFGQTPTIRVFGV